ncbi:MAG: glycosyltransferase [Candidatus Sumerlaeota bacterium]|nr:glycosyltransferase [Candidatus Sumerlaeota bacterium]
MKILHIIPFFAPAWVYGGPVRTTFEVTRRLAARGHELTVFTTDVRGSTAKRDDAPYSEKEIMKGIAIPIRESKEGIVVPKKESKEGFAVERFGHWGGQYAPYFAPSLGGALQTRIKEFDVVHTSCGFSWTGVQARAAALRAGVPYIYQAHSALDSARRRQRRWSKIAFFALYEKRVLRDAAGLIALTEFEKREYLKLGARAERIAVIPNGVDPALFQALEGEEPGAFRRKYGIASGRPLIAYAGRLERIKGVDRLLEAFHLARAKIPEALLVLAGPDEGMRGRLEARARELGLTQSVLFTGELTAPEIRLLYRDAGILALFSYDEGLPMTVLEALAAGLPMAISEECHVPEVGEAGAGIVVSGGDVTAFAAAMVRLLEDDDLRRSSALRARELAARRFSWKSAVDRIESLYQSIAPRK